MKKILVPTDFSKEAENAMKVAAKLAREHDCEIILLHLLDQQPYSYSSATSSELPEALFHMQFAHKEFENIINKDYLEGLSVREMIDFKDVELGVKDISKAENIDLVVMGSHGASGLKELFVGSTAEKVVRYSDIPVLVIKNDQPNFHINDFVFASDFNEDNKQAYRRAVKLAKTFNAKIHLLMVNTIGNFTTTASAKVRISEFIKDVNFDNYTINIYNDETPEKGILNFSQIMGADLIGIGTHGRQGLAHFFNGSLSEDLVNHADKPVITFKI